MCSSKPKAPPPPPAVPEAPRMPAVGSDSMINSDAQRRRRASGGSANSTILTSASGVQTAGMTAAKTLLGQ